MERQLFERGQSALSSSIPFFRELFDPSAIDGDDAELTGNEETVSQDQQEDGREA